MDDQRWETAALRESQARRSGRPGVSQDRRRAPNQPAVWVTLREASDATGIPVGTLGSWARRGTVDSYLEGNGGRKLRIVELNEVRGRARELGRPVAPVPVRHVAHQPLSPTAPVLPPKRGETDENVMIVPLDAWNKVLNQLGNLHEAGQQLAEARERAAKAETEAAFLRERLAEMRDTSPPPLGEVAAASAADGGGYPSTEEEPPSPPAAVLPPKGGETETPSPPAAAPEEPAPPTAEAVSAGAGRSAAEGASSSSLWQYLYRTWKSRRR